MSSSPYMRGKSRTRAWEHTVVLRDLVSVRLVLVEVVFAVKITLLLHLATECYGCTNSWDQGGFLKDLDG